LAAVLGTEIHKRDVVVMNTYEASMMSGCENGVVLRFRNQVNKQYLVGIHCSGHQLELAMKYELSEDSTYKRLSGLLLGIYLLYKNSPLNESKLKPSSAVL